MNNTEILAAVAGLVADTASTATVDTPTVTSTETTGTPTSETSIRCKTPVVACSFPWSPLAKYPSIKDYVGIWGPINPEDSKNPYFLGHLGEHWPVVLVPIKGEPRYDVFIGYMYIGTSRSIHTSRKNRAGKKAENLFITIGFRWGFIHTSKARIGTTEEAISWNVTKLPSSPRIVRMENELYLFLRGYPVGQLFGLSGVSSAKKLVAISPLGDMQSIHIIGVRNNNSYT